jgi:hypothetical protein
MIALGSAEESEVFPENGPRLPGRTADEDVRVVGAETGSKITQLAKFRGLKGLNDNTRASSSATRPQTNRIDRNVRLPPARRQDRRKLVQLGRPGYVPLAERTEVGFTAVTEFLL